MKQAIIIITCLMCYLSVIAKNRYDERLLEQGRMYFLRPTKMKPEKTSDRLEYDMTILTFRDSITLNMTLNSPNYKAKAIKLNAGNSTFTANNIEVFYRDRAGKKFKTRYHIMVPMVTYKELFLSETPLCITIEHEGGSSTFTYSLNKWRNERKSIDEIFDSIEFYK